MKQLMDAVQSSIQVLRFIITCVFSNSLSNLLDLREKKTHILYSIASNQGGGFLGWMIHRTFQQTRVVDQDCATQNPDQYLKMKMGKIPAH